MKVIKKFNLERYPSRGRMKGGVVGSFGRGKNQFEGGSGENIGTLIGSKRGGTGGGHPHSLL